MSPATNQLLRLALSTLLAAAALGCGDTGGVSAPDVADDAPIDVGGDIEPTDTDATDADDPIVDTLTDVLLDASTDAPFDGDPRDGGDGEPDDAVGEPQLDVDASDPVDTPDAPTDVADTLDLTDTADASDANAPDRADSTEVIDAARPDTADVDDTPTCDELGPRIEARWAELSTCERSTQCAVRSNPLCPFGGCFTYFATGRDLSELDEDERDYRSQSCSTLSCACPPVAPTPFCDDGACIGCPIDCPTTCPLGCECVTDDCGCPLAVCADDCAAMADALEVAVGDLARCSSDDDCVARASGLCDALPCQTALHGQAGVGHLDALIEAYLDAGCEAEPACVCDTSAPPTCVLGLCRLP